MINRFTQQLWQDLNQFMQGAGGNTPLSQSQLHRVVESALRQCHLVTREEFDAQQVVLHRSREKIDRLEKQVAELESALPGSQQSMPPDDRPVD